MTDFSSRLDKLKNASKAKNESEKDKFKKFIEEWEEKKKIIEPVLKETEREFLLEETAVSTREDGGTPTLFVGTDERRQYQLRFHADWPNCRVAIKVRTPSSDRESVHSLQEITQEFVESQVEAFLRVAMRLGG